MRRPTPRPIPTSSRRRRREGRRHHRERAAQVRAGRHLAEPLADPRRRLRGGVAALQGGLSRGRRTPFRRSSARAWARLRRAGPRPAAPGGRPADLGPLCITLAVSVSGEEGPLGCGPAFTLDVLRGFLHRRPARGARAQLPGRLRVDRAHAADRLSDRLSRHAPGRGRSAPARLCSCSPSRSWSTTSSAPSPGADLLEPHRLRSTRCSCRRADRAAARLAALLAISRSISGSSPPTCRS